MPTRHMGAGVKSTNPKKFYSTYDDDMTSQQYVNFASGVLGLCIQNTDGFVFWNVSYNANSRHEFIEQIIPYINRLIDFVVWNKTNAIPQKSTFARVAEPIFVFSTNGGKIPFDKSVRNLWTIDSAGAQSWSDHKAAFPVALPHKAISLIPENTGIVLEPFCGSGSTLMAAEQLGRKCYAIELDSHYCDIILQRWEDFTGEKAKKIN